VARIDLTTHIAAPRERCFDLARSVELHTQSAAGTGEIAVAGRTRGLLDLGDEVTWQGRHFCIRQTLTSRITAFERPAHFRDTMVRGAFARLEHDHHFTEQAGGGTLMRDVFEFTAPYGVLGVLAERLVLTRYLRRFLVARNETIKRVAESDAWRAFLEATRPGP
jgi:ligand-binding SRPBCC domain-containing protein